MRIFLAGATGVIGRRLALLLRDAGHDVAGTTRNPKKASWLEAVGVVPVVVDVFDAQGMAEAAAKARPDVIIHQLTDLASGPGTPGYAAAQEANRRLRIEGTRNLVRAAKMSGVSRVIAQSIAFAYARGEAVAEPPRQRTVEGIVALEREVLQTPPIAGVVLRYGYFYGPGTWYDSPPKSPSVHVDAAAHAALLALDKGNGIYNVTENDGAVTSARATRELGFEPTFRMPAHLLQEMAGST